jgi:hypothetical protein
MTFKGPPAMPDRLRLRTSTVGLVLAGAALASSAALMAVAPAPQGAGLEAATAAIPETIVFNRDVRPILSDKCYQCHGPGTQMATLRFDTEEGAKKALAGNRFAIVAGDPEHSELIARITATDPRRRMPQKNDALSPRDVEIVRRWIAQGASWQTHWAFIPPVRPVPLAVATQALVAHAPAAHAPATQAVATLSWVRSPIDAFVLARLEREGLQPSPEADRPTWLRRVTLDLTGLPPTLPDLDAFLADRTPNAYEKVVDRLLRSPRYGERMAFPWLDAARYADSNGYQSDGERHMWRWRDWVIEAFNRNMPFDQFTVEQLAGDMLPNATLDQRIATGFNRNHRGNSEGGIIPEEYQVEYVVDRVDTTSTVFMGLTAGCARCHNHKYDPIPQKDYYQLFSYFNNIPEQGKARRLGNSPPVIKAPTREQLPKLQALDAQLAAADTAFTRLEPEIRRAQRAWERSVGAAVPTVWGPTLGLVAHVPLDGDLAAPVATTRDGKPGVLRASAGEPRFGPGRIGQAASFDGTSFIQGGDITGFDSHGFYDDKYSLAAWIHPTADTGAIVTKAGDIVEPNGHGLHLRNGKVEYDYVSKWVDEGIRLTSKRSVTLDAWHQVTLTYDGSRYAEGVALYVDGERWQWDVQLDDLNNPRPLRREPLRIGGGGGPENRFKGRIDDVRIYDRDLSAAEAKVLADALPVGEIAGLAESVRTEAQTDKIRGHFLDEAAPAGIRQAWAQLLAARAARNTYYEGLPTSMVMEERPIPRESHVLVRGTYDRPGEVVTPTLPSIVASPADNAAYPADRLGLARWLVNPSHPLTARVTVNRFWQMYFGTGIVKTVEDFGSQGEPPVHPELLDWLATEFIRTGWDVKAMQKRIVLSATYRQSSAASTELLQRDPDNRLLARGPSVRLSAEMVRDQALAMAGLLVDKVGGPSVYPYQPAGLWREMNSYEDYDQGHGDDLYRRSLYTYWKRTVPPPTMANFDASSRESCVVRPNITNTPLQALDLMNNVTYVEAARVLAERMMKEGGTTPQGRIAYAFRLATAKPPSAAEGRILANVFAREIEEFGANPARALEYVSHGERKRDERLAVRELAAYTTVASLILNQSRTVTRD